MNKLLIIGDSFADPGPRQFHPSPSWTTILEKESGYQVVNKARGGSGLYYAIKCFNDLQENFDKILLTVTNPGRIYVPILGSKFTNQDHSIHHHTQNTFYNEVWKQELDKSDKDYIIGLKTLDAISAYYAYVYNFEEQRYYHKLMLDDLKRRRPDIIFVPALFPALPNQTNPVCLNDISEMELKHYGLTYEHINGFDLRTDIRRCHMSVENNRILAEKAKGWLKGDPVQIDVNDFKKPTEPIDVYFPLRKVWTANLNTANLN